MSGGRSSRDSTWRGAPRCASRRCPWPTPVRRRPARAAVATWFRVVEPSYLAVERMRQSHLDAVVGLVDGYQTAHMGSLDRVGIRDPPQRRHVEWLSDGECVDHLADELRQRTETGFDQFDQSLRHDRFADPLPVAVLLLNTAVRDLLLDDVAKIQSVPARQLPQPGGGVEDAPARPTWLTTTRRPRRPKAVAGPVGRTGRPSISRKSRFEQRSPSRTVSTTLAASRCTIWCRTNVDSSSSRCTSSTPNTTVVPGGADVTESMTPRTS